IQANDSVYFFFFQAEDGIRDRNVTGVQTCALPIFGEKRFKYNQVDAIIFVSSTGIATPSLDAYLMNERNFREDVVRMPIWGLGCTGGAMGLSRGFEWLQTNRDKSVLVVACELCSLTFQKEDNKLSNLVGTALFGDGVEATLLIGEESLYQSHLNSNSPIVYKTSSRLKKNKLDVMGWDVTQNGMEVIFSKNIPKLIPGFWKKHVTDFLRS